MAVMHDPRLKSTTPSLESFEETYKTAYSHGLEAIYSLETVDLKKVRKIEAIDKDEKNVSIVPPQHPVYKEEAQLLFDFGPAYRGWIPPYFVEEPIGVLALSFQAQSCLLEHGLTRLSDLLAQNFRDYVFLKGMGQGHIDEIQKKLKSYIAGRSQERSSVVDLRSLILSLSVGISFKKLFHFLKDFGLEKFIPLSYSEKIEMKTFNHSNEATWKEEVRSFLLQESLQNTLVDCLEEITEVFLLPWMRLRQGIASEEELIERFEKISAQPGEAQAFLSFVKGLSAGTSFPFSSSLHIAEKGIYCSDREVLDAYREIIGLAKSYFYRADSCYTLEELTRHLLREFARQWKGYSAEQVQTFIKKSPSFVVLRSPNGSVVVRLA